MKFRVTRHPAANSPASCNLCRFFDIQVLPLVPVARDIPVASRRREGKAAEEEMFASGFATEEGMAGVVYEQQVLKQCMHIVYYISYRKAERAEHVSVAYWLSAG